MDLIDSAGEDTIAVALKQIEEKRYETKLEYLLDVYVW